MWSASWSAVKLSTVLSSTSGSIAVVWKQLAAQLPKDDVATVRSEYLRYALSLWRTSENELRQPDRAVDLLDLLDVLFLTE